MRWLDTRICDRWTLSFPDLPDLGGWDVWEYWERERFFSLAEHLTPADVLMDVGAEFGGLSAVIATMLGGASRMILVEPEPSVWPTIRAVFEHNGLGAPARSVVALMSDYNDNTLGPEAGEQGWPTCSDNVAEDDLEGRRVYRYLHDNVFGSPQVTIDWATVIEPYPTALNLDVEGAELRVLRGAQRLLTTVRPLVWVSIHPDLMERDYGDTPADLDAYMTGLGYEGTFLAEDHERHVMWRHPQGR